MTVYRTSMKDVLTQAKLKLGEGAKLVEVTAPHGYVVLNSENEVVHSARLLLEMLDKLKEKKP